MMFSGCGQPVDLEIFTRKIPGLQGGSDEVTSHVGRRRRRRSAIVSECGGGRPGLAHARSGDQPVHRRECQRLVARVVLEQVSRQIGQSFVIENRPGAGGTIGAPWSPRRTGRPHDPAAALVAWLLQVVLHKSLPFDPVRDFAPVVLFGGSRACWWRRRPRAGRSVDRPRRRGQANPGG